MTESEKPSAEDQPADKPPTLSYASPGLKPPSDLPAILAIIFALLPFATAIGIATLPEPLAVGLVFTAFASPILALVYGVIARAAGKDYPRRKMANIAMIIASLELLAILTSIVLPGLQHSHPRADRAKCASNLRQIGQGLALYRNDFGPRFPDRFEQLLVAYEMHPEVFVCPSSDDEGAMRPTTQAMLAVFATPGHCSYTYLAAGQSSPVPPGFVIAHDRSTNHHDHGINVLYGDGSVKSLDKSETQYLLAELAAGHNPPWDPTTQPAALRR